MRQWILFVGTAVLGATSCTSIAWEYRQPSGTGGGGAGGSSSTASGAAVTSSHGAGGAASSGSGQPTCADGVKNGSETDIDCGADACPPCALGKQCQNDGDCSSKACSGGVCVMTPGPQCNDPTDAGATCNDCLQNGLETDIDCGGDSCLPCGAGKRCLNDGDCKSGKCVTQANLSKACAP